VVFVVNIFVFLKEKKKRGGGGGLKDFEAEREYYTK